MAYANEAEYAAALTAYRALHDVFYAFHRRVREAPSDPANGPELDLLRAELLPALARAYRGAPEYVQRLTETLRRMGEPGVPSAAADSRTAYQAYVDVDNILQHLLAERAQYPAVFDRVFGGAPPALGPSAGLQNHP